MVQEALTVLGDVPAAALVAYVERQFGQKILPAFIPIIKATIRDKEVLANFRAAARAAQVESAQVPSLVQADPAAG